VLSVTTYARVWVVIENNYRHYVTPKWMLHKDLKLVGRATHILTLQFQYLWDSTLQIMLQKLYCVNEPKVKQMRQDYSQNILLKFC